MGISTTNFPQLVRLPTGFLVGINSMTVAEVLYIVTLTSPQYLFAPLGTQGWRRFKGGGGVLFFTFPPQKKVQVGVVVTLHSNKNNATFFWEGKSCWGQEDVCVFFFNFVFFLGVNVVIDGCWWVGFWVNWPLQVFWGAQGRWILPDWTMRWNLIFGWPSNDVNVAFRVCYTSMYL